MERFQNDDLEYIFDDYYDFDDFVHDDLFAEPEPWRDTADFDSFDSEFEDDFESVRSFFRSLSRLCFDSNDLDSRICY